MRRYQNEEACFVLLTILERLAADEASFVHGIALKGGILMAGELRSARSSADIDATTGRGRRVDPDQVAEDIRRAGRGFGLRLEGEPDRTLGGLIVRFRFDSLTDAGTAKLEVSVREDLVFAVRDAFFDVSELGLQPITVPAVAEVELVAEKLRALVQRAQPRDLFDLHLYLVDSGWHLDPDGSIDRPPPRERPGSAPFHGIGCSADRGTSPFLKRRQAAALLNAFDGHDHRHGAILCPAAWDGL